MADSTAQRRIEPHHIVLGSSAGGGIVVAWGVMEALQSNPQLLGELLKWGPVFALGVIALVVVELNFVQTLKLGREGVEAQKQMATAMESISHKDDRQAEEMRTQIGFNAMNSQKVIERLHEQRQALDILASSISAQAELLQEIKREVGTNKGEAKAASA